MYFTFVKQIIDLKFVMLLVLLTIIAIKSNLTYLSAHLFCYGFYTCKTISFEALLRKSFSLIAAITF